MHRRLEREAAMIAHGETLPAQPRRDGAALKAAEGLARPAA